MTSEYDDLEFLPTPGRAPGVEGPELHISPFGAEVHGHPESCCCHADACTESGCDVPTVAPPRLAPGGFVARPGLAVVERDELEHLIPLGRGGASGDLPPEALEALEGADGLTKGELASALLSAARERDALAAQVAAVEAVLTRAEGEARCVRDDETHVETGVVRSALVRLHGRGPQAPRPPARPLLLPDPVVPEW